MDPWGNADFQRRFRAELERIDADETLRAGFATNVPMTPTQVLAALRATASGAGSQAFYAELERVLGGRWGAGEPSASERLTNVEADRSWHSTARGARNER